MKDATLTQVINTGMTTAQPKESPRAAVPMPCEDKIRERAYLKWQVAGCPEDDGIDFWLQTEREVALQASRSACQSDTR